MTGFARAEGRHGATGWAWELKSVNARGLDLRCRLPSGCEMLEPEARQRVAAALKRGAVTVSLALTDLPGAEGLRINRAALDRILTLHRELDGTVDPAPPRLEWLLAVRGVVEAEAEALDEAARAARDAALLAGLDAAIAGLVRARREEGERLADVLAALLGRLAGLTRTAGELAQAQPAQLRERLVRQLGELLAASPPVSEERLAVELAVLATKADVREEIDRLTAHLAQAEDLLRAAEPVGRRLDFLCQELNRESNTLCSKSADLELTRVGIELKTAVEQLREQVQNVE